MYVFFAGGLGIEFDKDSPVSPELLEYRLLSYHYMNQSLSESYFREYRDRYRMIIMDSGAFSAWNAGSKIILDDYISYLKDYIDEIDYVVNLDVIPGVPGLKRIPIEEVERSAAKGYDNYNYMLSKGIPEDKIIHVFHQNEDFKWLQRMLDDKMTYIGISPANDRTTKEKIMWLDRCMEYVCDDKGYPTVKFHGFAVTSLRLMLRYPWYSVDSSTWAMRAGRGEVMIPVKKDGKWDFSQPPLDFRFSNVVLKKTHYTLVTGYMKELIDEYLEQLHIPLGRSEFIQVDSSHKLAKNERICSKNYVRNLKLPAPEPGKKWVEVVLERGIVNDWRYRQLLNIYFLRNFAQSKKEPARFVDMVKPSLGLL